MITEYCERGSLADILAKAESARLLTEERKWQLLLQIASALEFLHSRKPAIVHRDVKSSNVLISQAWLAKLADFGLLACRLSTARLAQSRFKRPSSLKKHRRTKSMQQMRRAAAQCESPCKRTSTVSRA